MTRYFMTIPEAVQLVIQAGAIGGRGQVFVLDMGEPVRIVDLADTMIRLSGKEPGTDIEIEFIGARPGEKLHEELWSDHEPSTPSRHEAILLVTRPPIDAAWLEAELDELERLVVAGETLELVGRLNAIVAAGPSARRSEGRDIRRGRPASADGLRPPRLGYASRAERRMSRRSAGSRSTPGSCPAASRARTASGERQELEPPPCDQLLVDRAHPTGERRVDGDAERRCLAVHRPAGRDHEIRQRHEALGVERVLRDDERREARAR